jgi:hypothetical protein
MASQLPSATVTFLFTDVEGSTRLLHELGAEALRERPQDLVADKVGNVAEVCTGVCTRRVFGACLSQMTRLAKPKQHYFVTQKGPYGIRSRGSVLSVLTYAAVLVGDRLLAFPRSELGRCGGSRCLATTPGDTGGRSPFEFV